MNIRKPLKVAGTAPVRDDGPRINDAIDVTHVLLIDPQGDNKGVVPIAEALALAQESGLDLVEVSPGDRYPVCKIIDYGKYKFQAQKKAAEARKKQKVIEVKEIKIRPGIDTHDYDVKVRSIVRFFSDGNKVKISMRFRGREMAHIDLGSAVFDRLKADTAELSKVELEPKLEGRQMIMVLVPKA